MLYSKIISTRVSLSFPIYMIPSQLKSISSQEELTKLDLWKEASESNQEQFKSIYDKYMEKIQSHLMLGRLKPFQQEYKARINTLIVLKERSQEFRNFIG